MAVTLNASTTTGLVQSADTSGSLNIQSNGTTVLGVTSTGTSVTGTQSVSGNLSFNSGYGSSAVAYGCRAWVNFNGTSGVTIRGSGNVTSVTRSSGGVYFVTFTNNMPDVNFCFVGSASVSSGNFGFVAGDEIGDRTVSRTGTFYTVNGTNVNAAADANNINITIFR